MRQKAAGEGKQRLPQADSRGEWLATRPKTLLGLVYAAALLVVWTSCAFFVHKNRTELFHQAELELQGGIATVAGHVNRSLQSTTGKLTAISGWFEAASRAPQRPGLTDLEAYVRNLERFDADPTGFRLISNELYVLTLDNPDRPLVYVGDREYLRDLAGKPPGTIALGLPIVSRVTGRQLLPATIRLSPNPYGVAFAISGVYLDEFRRSQRNLLVTAPGHFWITRSDGYLVYIEPDPGNASGRTVPADVLDAVHRDGPALTTVRSPVAADRKWITANAALARPEFVLHMSMDPLDLWRSWWGRAWWKFLAALILTLAATGTYAFTRRQFERYERLRAATADRLRDFAEAGSDFFWEIGPDGETTYGSPRYAEMVSVEPAEAIRGATGGDLTGPALPGMPESSAVIASRKPFRDLIHAERGRDGVLRHYSLSGVPVTDETGRHLGFRGRGTDFTGREMVFQVMRIVSGARQDPGDDDGLRALAVRLSGVLPVDIVAIVVADGEGDRAVLCAGRGGDAASTDAGTLRSPFVEAVLAEGTKTIATGCAGLFPRDPVFGGMEADSAIGVALTDGSARAVGALVLARRSAIPYAAIVGAIARLIAPAISGEMQRHTIERQRQSLADELRNAERLRVAGTLAASFAHDFNNILTPIGGYSYMLSREIPEDSAAAGLVARLRKALRRATRLTEQFLDFGRPDPVEFGPVSIGEVLHDTAEVFTDEIPPEIDVEIHVDPATPLVRGDAGQIQRLLLNLGLNARQAIGDRPGRISVTVAPHADPGDEPPPRWVRIVVSDTGSGMDDATIAHLFDPFFTTRRDGGGTGLGLAVVKRVLESHMGRIAVKSAPGAGATFTVDLPATETDWDDGEDETLPPGEEEPWAAAAETTLDGIRILCVDDERDIRDMFAAVFAQHGCIVETAAHSADALRLLGDGVERFDIVITDIIMPHGSGADIVDWVAANAPGLPVIVVSGFVDDATRSRAEISENVVWLGKPVGPRRLIEAVRASIAASKRRR